MNQRVIRKQALENLVRRIQNQILKLQKISNRFSWYRLIIFFGGLGIGFLIYWYHVTLSWIIIGITLLVFNIVAYFHRQIEFSLKKHQIWLELKRTHIARMTLDWANIPAVPFSKSLIDHPFAVDLDITGERSLHQLIDLTVSQNGSQRLLNWLLETEPDIENIQQRQSIIRELRPLAHFRDRLILIFKLVSEERLDSKTLLSWLRSTDSVSTLPRMLLITGSLCVITLTLLLLHLLNMIPAYWLISLGLYIGIYFFNRRHLTTLLEDTILLDTELKKTKAIFRYLEQFNYQNNENLAHLCSPFLDKSSRPSTQLKNLTYIMIAIGLRHNYLLGTFLNLISPWDFFWAYRLGKAKQRLAGHFPEWLELAFKLEALISLANFAYLNPDYAFPEINLQKNNVPFLAEHLGHPLLPPEQKICNDFQVIKFGEIILITGSNMAGKSTFLRTLGINLCLAYAGAPVNASHFQTRLFRVFCCIQVADSVTGGFSQFYAEVKRLSRLLDLLASAQTLPVFFLIDEIFKGTNNRERLIGSRSYIKNVIHQKGLGVITTHDLELTKLAENFTNIHNYHFREEVIAGKMVFDYQLRHGPCPTTNALKIMRLEGLPVEEF